MKQLSEKKPYLSNTDIREIYMQIKVYNKGCSAFQKDAEGYASKTKNDYSIYKDELALFMVFQRHLGQELKMLRIDSFGRLMQYIS